jgi:hypothetical protein
MTSHCAMISFSELQKRKNDLLSELSWQEHSPKIKNALWVGGLSNFKQRLADALSGKQGTNHHKPKTVLQKIQIAILFREKNNH